MNYLSNSLRNSFRTPTKIPDLILPSIKQKKSSHFFNFYTFNATKQKLSSLFQNCDIGGIGQTFYLNSFSRIKKIFEFKDKFLPLNNRLVQVGLITTGLAITSGIIYYAFKNPFEVKTSDLNTNLNILNKRRDIINALPNTSQILTEETKNETLFEKKITFLSELIKYLDPPGLKNRSIISNNSLHSNIPNLTPNPDEIPQIEDDQDLPVISQTNQYPPYFIDNIVNWGYATFGLAFAISLFYLIKEFEFNENKNIVDPENKDNEETEIIDVVFPENKDIEETEIIDVVFPENKDIEETEIIDLLSFENRHIVASKNRSIEDAKKKKFEEASKKEIIGTETIKRIFAEKKEVRVVTEKEKEELNKDIDAAKKKEFRTAIKRKIEVAMEKESEAYKDEKNEVVVVIFNNVAKSANEYQLNYAGLSDYYLKLKKIYDASIFSQLVINEHDEHKDERSNIFKLNNDTIELMNHCNETYLNIKKLRETCAIAKWKFVIATYYPEGKTLLEIEKHKKLHDLKVECIEKLKDFAKEVNTLKITLEEFQEKLDLLDEALNGALDPLKRQGYPPSPNLLSIQNS